LDFLKTKEHIVHWLTNYCDQAGAKGFVIGISGGIDSAVTSTLCALTNKKVVLVNMPIRQSTNEYNRSKEHIEDLSKRYQHVISHEVNLTDVFSAFEKILPPLAASNKLSMANTRG